MEYEQFHTKKSQEWRIDKAKRKEGMLTTCEKCYRK